MEKIDIPAARVLARSSEAFMVVTVLAGTCFWEELGNRGWRWAGERKDGVADEGDGRSWAGSRERLGASFDDPLAFLCVATRTPIRPLLCPPRSSPRTRALSLSFSLRGLPDNTRTTATVKLPHAAPKDGRQSASCPLLPPLTNDLAC